MKKIVSLLFCLMFGLTLSACGGTPNVPDLPGDTGSITDPSDDNGGSQTDVDEFEYGKVDDSGDHVDFIHYLSFEVEGTELVKWQVQPTDTYESLEPFFPLVPEKENYIGYWEKIDSVYSEEELTITICAYYRKIN